MQVNAEFARFRWMFPISLLVMILLVITGPYLYPHVFDRLIRMTLIFGLARMTYMAMCSSISLF